MPLDKVIGMIANDFRKLTQGDMQSSNNVQSGPVQFERRHNALEHNRAGAGVMTRNGSNVQMNSVSAGATSGSGPFVNSNVLPNRMEKRLTDEIAYLLQTTISEGGVQFLSLQQIDTVIEYFTRERDRLTSRPSLVGIDGSSGQAIQQSGPNVISQSQSSQSQSSNSIVGNNDSSAASLFENPQVKEAIKSLLSIGALGSQQQQQQSNQQRDVKHRLLFSG